jgi:hypothetical protein
VSGVSDAEPTLGELVEVAQVDTVVRLDGPGGRLAELVLTGDVVQSLSKVLAAAGGETGAGFFVVGPFGSGKSHFLSAVGELLAEPAAAADLAGWDRDLRRMAEAARSSIQVSVPLVEYRAKAGLEDVVAERAWRALGGKPSDAGTDRLVEWDGFLGAALATGRDGVVVLLDELSEFLRAKQGAALSEDLRFLQFLGEWTRDRPVVVLGALQENIDEVANVSQRELARIRDRYEPSLTLSMRHVEDLVRGRLVHLRLGAEQYVDRAHAEITAAFPDHRLPHDRFVRCYPLHPATLTLLEGLRFLLSQQRGVVDFVCAQLRDGLGRGYAELITPDQVFDHFRSRLHERSESAPLADTVVPHYERAVTELVDADDRALALRTVKLLCLLEASPLERPRTASELASMLLARVSDLDPNANVAYLEQAILEPLVGRGAYVVAEAGPPSTYRVELGADATVVARTRVAQARAELSASDRRVVGTLVALGSSPVLPLQLLADVGLARREFLWQNTRRALLVGTARILELAPNDATQLVDKARSTRAEGCLLVGEVELDEAPAAVERAGALAGSTDRLAVWVPASPSPDELDALLDIHSRRLVLDAARAEGRSDVADVLERAADADAAQARELLRRLYFDGRVLYPGEGPGADLPSLAGLAFDRQLGYLADPLLAHLHPRHRDVAPRGELVGDRIVRQLVGDVIAAGRLGLAAVTRGQLRSVIEGYLVPLGLARVRNDGVTVAPDPARSPAVAETLRLVGDGDPVPAAGVVQRLADGPIGLTEPEAILVLNACAQTGLIEAWRGRRRLTDPFLAITPTDNLGAGELVETAVRSAVAGLAPIAGPGPFEPWTSSTQRSAWDYAQAWLSARREDLGQVRSTLARFGEVPALGGADPGPVLDDLALVGGVVDACSVGTPSAPPDGLRRLVAAVADGPALLGAARRLGAVARFGRDDLRRVDEAAAYLTHPQLTIPDDLEALRLARDTAVEMLRETLRLAADDRSGDFFTAYREFRSAYTAAYQQAHDRYYAAVSAADVDKIKAGPEYRALARLSGIGAVAVPDDRVKLDRVLAGAAPPPCRARVDVELGWKPRCTCGFALGDKELSLDRDAALAIAARGVRQHLDELARPEHRSRLDEAATDLASLGRAELADDVRRLEGMASEADTVDLGALAALLDGDLPRLLRDVLTGGQLIVTRDLATLREDLIGRRYTKRRLAELLAAWVDADDDVPLTGFVEVVDSAESRVATGLGGHAAAPVPSGTATGGTAAFLGERFPGLAAVLPTHQPADAFWLAAWWGDRPAPPGWLPATLVAEADRLVAAADAALRDLTALTELADLDERAGPDSVLGRQIAAALDLPSRSLRDVAAVLAGERLLRHPVRLAADEILRRVAGDWHLVVQLDPVARVASGHALLTEAEMTPVVHLAEAAHHLAALEQGANEASCTTLVEDLYPSHFAPVPELISRAEVACAGSTIVGSDTVDAVRTGAARLLQAVDARFREHADGDFAGCLRIWEVGEAVVAPLLAEHGRVAVVLVDAMRADLAARVVAAAAARLPGRPVQSRWAVVPSPTRTAEAVAALRTGRPVAGGSVPVHPEATDVPFAHLGYEATALVGADRDHHAADLHALWTSGPPISVAVATSVDERLHRTSVELAGLLDDARTAICRRIIPSLTAVPSSVPIVVLADHGFRENPSWGQGPEGRYVHGGTSLEESVIPIVVFGAIVER